jgi:hypothetical protein
MSSKEYQWEVKLIRDRYNRFKVTLEQAKQVYKYEGEKLAFSSKHLLSAWEELDFERTFFKDILSTKQFEIYEKEYKRLVNETRQALIEADKEAVKDLQYNQELLEYYKKKLLPAFSGISMRIINVGLREENAKCEFLKCEYKRFLNDVKFEVISSHFRHNRTYQPTYLKAALLRHELLCTWPDYSAFKQKMDEPTLSVAEFLEKRVQRLLPSVSELIKRTMKHLETFQDKLLKKHYGKQGGWHVIMEEENEEEVQNRVLMNVMLLD